MEQQSLAALTDAELLQEAKKMKSTNLYDALIIGFLIGISIYSAVKNGFGWLTFLPFIYLPIAGKNKAKHKALAELLTVRNLKQ